MAAEKSPSDYERYLRTAELLSLQKRPEELAHPDELLFQVTHQAAELWLKLVAFELARARDAIPEGTLAAVHGLRRSAQVMALLVDQIALLETMAPADYHAFRVKSLGRGSGQQSPGFRHLLAFSPTLYPPFAAALDARGLDLLALHRARHAHEDLWQLAQALMEYDERFTLWRLAHIQLVRRMIGMEVLSLQGVPAEQLWQGARETFYPELWKAVEALTRAHPPTY